MDSVCMYDMVWISMRPTRLVKVHSESLPQLPEVDRRGKYFHIHSATAVSLSLEIQKCPSHHSLLLTCRRLQVPVMAAATGAGSGQHLHVVGHGMLCASTSIAHCIATHRQQTDRQCQGSRNGRLWVRQRWSKSAYPRND